MQFHRTDNETVVVSPETIGIHNAAKLRLFIEEEIRNGQKKILLDMTLTSRIYADGIGTMVSVHTTAELKGAQVWLCGLNKPVREAFELTRLHDKLNFAPTVAAAATAS